MLFGIPNQNINQWKKDLNSIIDLAPEHISAYTLTAERGTELFSMVLNNKLKMPKKETGLTSSGPSPLRQK